MNESVKNAQVAIAQTQQKLDDYNAFLMNPDREPGTVYPGFLKEKSVVEKIQELKASRAPKKESKKTAAIRIYQEENGNLPRIKERFMSELAMSKFGAQTYMYATKKLLTAE